MAQNTAQPTIQNPYLYGANADATNVATLYAPGELGAVFYNQNQKYQRVQLDSGATSANPVGAVAVAQTMFWKSKINKIVTNDKRQTLGGVTAAGSANAIAGILRVAATPGNYVDILQKGDGVSVASNGSGAVGDYAISDTTTSTARVTNTAAGTAPPSQNLGLIRAVAANNLITVDVDIASVD